ncbi:PD-(D/E)XK nuclease-like domain-containing protein [Yersinia rochesterensis]|uniref:PD-(D/E)XK nuclease-like domain-containing protein n=1 Tax=Yersinia rochesterensis TaxID=1604335 RepID=UPI0011A4EC9E|nr:PD-(D/E)XK nuclease-like domain-containing protein [Yersinia rochesterensis]
MNPGIYYDIPNETYHSGSGVSKSMLDMVALDPSLIQWRKNAPVDTDKLSALDMGTALHCALLEPDEFDNRFIKAPLFNRRSTEGKEKEKAFIADCEGSGKIILDHEQHRQLTLMRGSTFAHPAAKFLLEEDGFCESSIYWIDDETSELCRVRPDRYLRNRPVVIDVKKTADMERFFRWHIEGFRYHVQAAMYSDGFYQHFGEWPQFIFIVVSETIDCGRYPVRVVKLDTVKMDRGNRLYRNDLMTYHECRVSNNWGGIEIV